MTCLMPRSDGFLPAQQRTGPPDSEQSSSWGQLWKWGHPRWQELAQLPQPGWQGAHQHRAVLRAKHTPLQQAQPPASNKAFVSTS